MHVVSTDTECGEGEGPDLMKVRENGARPRPRNRPLMTLFGGHIGSEEERGREKKMGRLSLKPSYIVLASSLSGYNLVY